MRVLRNIDMDSLFYRLVLLLAFAASMVVCRDSLSVKLSKFNVTLEGMNVSTSDSIRWSFRVPPADVCLDNLMVLQLCGVHLQKISFHLDCRVIRLNVLLDKNAAETEVVSPLPGNHAGWVVTVEFQRFRRFIAFSVQGQRKVTTRLSGTNSKFSPQVARLIHHPLICQQSVTFNGLNLLGHTLYPLCDPNTYAAMPAASAPIYAGNILNVSALDQRVADCSLALVSKPVYGEVRLGNGLLYEHDGFVNDETLTFYAECERQDKLISIEVSAMQDEFVSHTRAVNITFERETILNSRFITISRAKMRYSVASSVYLYVTWYPRHGRLRCDGATLTLGNFFSLHNLYSGKLSYLVRDGNVAFEEEIRLEVKSRGVPTIDLSLIVSYEPTLKVNMRTLRVVEGEVVNVNSSSMDILYGVSRSVIVAVQVSPRHGKIVQSGSDADLLLFTAEDLTSNSVIYVHDGSETTFDSVSVHLTPTAAPEIAKSVVLNISIELVNDNEPKRNSSSAIYVVDGMDTYLDSNAISYTDADVDQLYAHITIEPLHIACGQIIRQKWAGVVTEFTQRDIMSGELIFHHLGDNSSCTLPLLVSDGEHVLSEVLEIVPMQYRLDINGTLSLNVSRKGETTLDKTVLLIDSNTKLPARQILIAVKRRPLHGEVVSTSPDRFTYEDLLSGLVTYKHLGTLSVSDTFTIKIRVDGLVRNLIIHVAIDTNADLLKPAVTRNLPIGGQVGTIVKLSSEMLLVYHRMASAAELLYQVPKKMGFLPLDFIVGGTNSSTAASSFTQQDINDGHVFYNIRASSRPSTLLVSFRGVSTDLVFKPIVLSGNMRTKVADTLKVQEGGVASVNQLFISPLNSSFENGLLSIVVTQRPSSTRLYYNYTEETTVFSLRDLTEGLISLRHDGSEVLVDKLKCRLRYPSTRSAEREVTVHIVPVNDHYPRFNNSGQLQPLTICVGENVTATNSSLLIEDMDSDSTPSSLMYTIPTLQRLGITILKKGLPCVQFTQADINSDSVIFHHLGTRNTSTGVRYLHMNISDGNFTVKRLLVITIHRRCARWHDSQKVFKVFPTLPRMIPYGELSHRYLSTGWRVMLVESNAVERKSGQLHVNSVTRQLKYSPSKHLQRTLCNSISSSVSDDYTLMVTHGLSFEPLHLSLNLSFLHLSRQILEDLDIKTTELIVMPNVPMLINSDVISAAGLARQYDVCKAKVRFGFFIARFPKGCVILGQTSEFVIWWDGILSSNYSMWCHNVTAIRPFQQLVVNVALQQEGRLWVMEDSEITIPVSVIPSLPSSKQIACRVSLLQGRSVVTLSDNVLTCLGETSLDDVSVAVVLDPSAGSIHVHGRRNKQFTLIDVARKHVTYVQQTYSKVDELLLVLNKHGRPVATVALKVYVEPNVISHDAIVDCDPIVITTELLDASPLIAITSDEATYWVTHQPTFGSLVSKRVRQTRAVEEPLTHFSHSDIVDEIVLYYPPNVLSGEKEDNFSYTLTSPGVQPSDGVFTVIFNQSESQSTPSLPEVRGSNVTLSILQEPVLTIIVTSCCIAVCLLTILLMVACLRKVQRRKQKRLAKNKSGAEPRLILAKENGSYKLLVTGGDEFPPTTYSSPSSPSRQLDLDRGSEVSSTVPQVRVTPLIDKDGTLYDLHDYVNCEDMTYFSPTDLDGYSSHSFSQSAVRPDALYDSFELLPTIERPEYFS